MKVKTKNTPPQSVAVMCLAIFTGYVVFSDAAAAGNGSDEMVTEPVVIITPLESRQPFDELDHDDYIARLADRKATQLAEKNAVKEMVIEVTATSSNYPRRGIQINPM